MATLLFFNNLLDVIDMCLGRFPRSKDGQFVHPRTAGCAQELASKNRLSRVIALGAFLAVPTANREHPKYRVTWFRGQQGRSVTARCEDGLRCIGPKISGASRKSGPAKSADQLVCCRQGIGMVGGVRWWLFRWSLGRSLNQVTN